jgi:peptidoglycan/xylan/chitin deacetylase (PgdA/CDA1 family)
LNDVLVLCYHAISPTWSAGLSVTPDAFERQITGMVRRGWTPATFTDAVCGRTSGRALVVTFDDAFASVKTYAQPVMARLGVTGTVFVPTAYVSQQIPLAWAGLDHWERSPYAAELTPLSWEDLGELAELGWEVGSHTRTHPLLTSLDDATLATELAGSREECAARMGRPVTSIAYPYGDVDDRVQTFTGDAGYSAAAALAWPNREHNCLRFPRVGVYHKDSWPRFLVKVGRWPRSTYGAKLLSLRG